MADILVVDDDLGIRECMTQLLELEGYEVECAINGQDALEKYALYNPDLVLLDVNMPVMEGLEALRRLKELDPNAVVIMLTSIMTRQAIESALELGAASAHGQRLALHQRHAERLGGQLVEREYAVDDRANPPLGKGGKQVAHDPAHGGGGGAILCRQR